MLTRFSDPTSVDPNTTTALLIKLHLISTNRDTGTTDRDAASIAARRIAPTVFRLHADPKLLAGNRIRRRNHNQPHRVTPNDRQLRPCSYRNEIPRGIHIHLDPEITPNLDKRLTSRTRPTTRSIPESNQNLLTLHQRPTSIHQIDRSQIHNLSSNLRTSWPRDIQIIRTLRILDLRQPPIRIRIGPDPNHSTAIQPNGTNNEN